MFFLLLLLSMAGFSYASEIIKPKDLYIHRLGKLEKIELTKEATILHFHQQALEGSLFISLPERLFLRNELNNHFYKLLKTENVQGNEISLQAGETISYRLFFEPIDIQSKSIQIGSVATTINSDSQTNYISHFINIKAPIKQKKQNKIFSDISIKKALQRAEKENKKVLLFFKERACPRCKWFENYVFCNEKIQKTIAENYIAVVGNLNNHRGLKLYRKYTTGKFFPGFVILNSQGKILKENGRYLSQEDVLNFIQFDKNTENENNIYQIKKTDIQSTSKLYRESISVSMGLINSKISNFSSRMRTAVSTDLLYTIDYDRKYLFRTGLSFAPRGSCDFSANYLKIPAELGWTAFESSVSDVPIRIRFVAAPYYAILLNRKNSEISRTDYGINLGIAPEIGHYSKLSVRFYYEYGGKDIFKNVLGHQRNHSFGLTASLTF